MILSKFVTILGLWSSGMVRSRNFWEARSGLKVVRSSIALGATYTNQNPLFGRFLTWNPI